MTTIPKPMFCLFPHLRLATEPLGWAPQKPPYDMYAIVCYTMCPILAFEPLSLSRTSLLSPIKILSLLPINLFACEMFFRPVFEHSTAFTVCCRSCPSLLVSFTNVSVYLLSHPVPLIFNSVPSFFGLGGFTFTLILEYVC